MNYFLYILRFSDNSLYIGQTNNLEKRLKEHRSKNTKASKFSKEHKDFELVYQEKFDSRLESMRREKQLKGWTRAKKEALISGDKELIKKL
ncbi:MAG: GIY-YIG nuclease family protein [Candidatus Zambryskibacteria bacterium]|nr:GIY-YIG nuclease family protein [Candidatus Zambryskibacteria bacterium]